MSREDRAKLPCMYFAYDSRTKGAKCPYLHDKNNLFKGPKPQARQKSSTSATATVSAGVARFIAGAAGGSTIKGAEAARASCSNAPSSGQEQSVGVLSDAKCIQAHCCYGSIHRSNVPETRVLDRLWGWEKPDFKEKFAGAMGSFLRCLS